MDETTYFQQMADASAANSAFNAQQAQLSRDWQTEMSNTAHQREVADLKAAGLNPILSANSGASVGSAPSAVADSSAAQGFANAAATVMNNAASIQMAGIAAGATLGAAAQAASASRYAADTNAAVSKDIAYISKGNTIPGVVDKYVWPLLSGALNSASSAFSEDSTSLYWQ